MCYRQPVISHPIYPALPPAVNDVVSVSEKVMNQTQKPFQFKFVDDSEAHIALELVNTTDTTLKSIEVLTIFLKDEVTIGGGPSQAHIKFECIKAMLPQEKAVISHRTWINGKPAALEYDQLARLKVREGVASPYVLDISWEDGDGKTRFQRISVGH